MNRRRRGRPVKSFQTDPDRYILALAHAFRVMGCSRRGALEVAVAVTHGIPVAPNPKAGWGRGLNLLEVRFEMRTGAVTIAGAAERLRRKMAAALADNVALRWLTLMSTAWLLALEHPPTAPVINQILALCSQAGERDFAATTLRRVLLRSHIIRGKTQKPHKD